MTREDGVSRRLARLADDLRRELGECAEVMFDDIRSAPDAAAWEVTPVNPDSLPVIWIDFGEELQVEAGHHGGRWELGRTMEDAEFIEQVVRAVVAGRVVEVFGPDRSRVEVTFPDGTKAIETGGVAPKGCLPVPGWRRRGRRVSYAPYS